MFMRDLRAVAKSSLPELQLVSQFLGDFPRESFKIRPNAKDPAYEEIVIPERMREFTARLSGIGRHRKAGERNG